MVLLFCLVPLKQDEPGSSTAVIVGPVVAIVVLVAVGAAVLLYRRHARLVIFNLVLFISTGASSF